MTLEEIVERMRRFDEVYLMEILNISSDDLIEAFRDRIEEHIEKLKKEVDEDE